MPGPQRPNPLQFPLTAENVDGLDATIEDIYQELRKLYAALALVGSGSGGASGPHALLSATHTDTTPAAGQSGDILFHDGSTWRRYAKGTNLHFLQLVAGLPAWGVDGSLLENLNAAELTGTVPPAAMGHNILSDPHLDSVPATTAAGDLLVAEREATIDNISLFWGDGLPYATMPSPLDTLGANYWLDGLPLDGLLSAGPVKWQRFGKGAPGAALVSTLTGLEWGSTAAGTSGAGDPIGAHATVSSPTTIGPGTGTTTFSFGSTLYDSGGFYSAGTPDRLIIPSDQGGLFLISAQVYATYGFADGLVIEILKNGTIIGHQESGTPAAGPRQCHAIADLLPSDYIQLRARLENGGAAATVTIGSNQTFLQVTKALVSEVVELPVGGSEREVLTIIGGNPAWSARPTLRDVVESISAVWDFVPGFKTHGHTVPDGEGQAYTPVLSNTGGGAALGNGTVTGRYSTINKTVIGYASLVVGATTNMGAAGFPIQLSLPTTAKAGSAMVTNGRAYDSSVATWFFGSGFIPSTTQIQCLASGAGGGSWDPNVPFAWAAGDVWQVQFVYEEP